MRQLEVLMVEDNLADATLISDLLKDIGAPVNLTVAENGKKALDILEKMTGEPTKPDLVILDLNLPMVDGFDILAYLKATMSLLSVPVLVMTGSMNKDDEKRARSMGANYCIKPSTVEEIAFTTDCLKKAISTIHR